MKILLVHNYYGSEAPSGENAVFEAERELLGAAGHEVISHVTSSDAIRASGLLGALVGGAATPFNPRAMRRVRRVIELERPDVMHVHNFFPLLSPAVLRAARGTSTATVLTLHNYRLFCAAAIPTRDGKVCTLCLDRRSARPGVRYGCYRGSRVATLPLAAMIALHRRLGTWQRDVDRFVTLTAFQRDRMAAAGLPLAKLAVKPHFVARRLEPLPWGEREALVVFLGRLGPEKGVAGLVEAWHRWGEAAPRLEVLGAGPEGERLRAQAAAGPAAGRIAFAGQVEPERALERLARARLLVLPSLCFEGFPMVVQEAYALGVPVAASRLGSLAELVREGSTGVLFAPGDAASLLAAVRGAWEDGAALERLGESARREAVERYAAGANLKMLEAIYAEAVAARRGGLRVGLTPSPRRSGDEETDSRG